jgi:hypothetical protein
MSLQVPYVIVLSNKVVQYNVVTRFCYSKPAGKVLPNSIDHYRMELAVPERLQTVGPYLTTLQNQPGIFDVPQK